MNTPLWRQMHAAATAAPPSADGPAHQFASMLDVVTHPRINELPESYRHQRHFWVFNLPEQETQIWLARFQLDHDFRQRLATHGPVIKPRCEG